MKSYLKYGLGTGLTSGCWGIICFTVVGWINHAFLRQRIPATDIRSYSGLFSILILAIGIYLAMKQARMKANATLTYGQALKVGLLVAAITALVAASFSWLYCSVINPGYADFMVSDVKRVLVAAGKSPQEISQRIERARREFSTAGQVMQALVGQAGIGSIISLILAAFMKSKKPA